ncbi:MAG TPA: DUF5829 family protein [Blastocatellia bacterium]|nr:DUF5829 family protein [Blastocatellia bacterium]
MKRILAMGLAISVLGSLDFGQDKKGSPVPVPLNHFFIVLDSATYKAIEESIFLRQQFAVSELRTTVRTDQTYKGVYFYGANTYFEFFDAAASRFGPVGHGGIALGVDQAGGLDILKNSLGPDLIVGEKPVTRLYDQKQVPWFYMAVPRGYSPASPLDLFIIEYHSDFLSEWNPEPGTPDRSVSRSRILRRYGKVLKADQANRLLEDVVALEVAVDKATETRLGGLCVALGYRLRKESGATLLEGPGITLKLVPATELARGIREITMRVRRAPERESEFQFGPKSSLSFQTGGTAIWSFK